ncbi:DUF1211 domain-containing protein [Telmatocola sphagniphila]|uniref:DUF1211 domain-containing protein n=1 Tax=Telmatocola sphagniphila TaxID=1123043 RepID=A0A8E6BCZ3_9BACT|nr:DUF1211 domain-containing protein [Telmatocola sphagniphila]
MSKGRLEAFSDGVFAIIITIMVLELKAPHDASLSSLKELIPTFLGYVLSFIYVGIYWNNHHHLFQAVKSVNGAILWANLHGLFWLSLFPVITHWVGVTHFAPWPVVVYGVVLLLAASSWKILIYVLIENHGYDSTLAAAMGRDIKGWVSLGLYLLAIILAFVDSWIACGIYLLVAFIWFIPDKRIERFFEQEPGE